MRRGPMAVDRPSGRIEAEESQFPLLRPELALEADETGLVVVARPEVQLRAAERARQLQPLPDQKAVGTQVQRVQRRWR